MSNPSAKAPAALHKPKPTAQPPASVHKPKPTAQPPASVHKPKPTAQPPASVHKPTPTAQPPAAAHKEPGQSSMAAGTKDENYWVLSGKLPYFSVVLAKTSVGRPYQQVLPTKVYKNLPTTKRPAVLTYRGTEWEMDLHGEFHPKKFANSGWKKFAVDNNLKEGDACVFELQKSESKLNFRVQILRSDFPAELMAKAEGLTASNPIRIV